MRVIGLVVCYALHALTLAAFLFTGIGVMLSCVSAPSLLMVGAALASVMLIATGGMRLWES